MTPWELLWHFITCFRGVDNFLNPGGSAGSAINIFKYNHYLIEPLERMWGLVRAHWSPLFGRYVKILRLIPTKFFETPACLNGLGLTKCVGTVALSNLLLIIYGSYLTKEPNKL